MCPLCNHSGGHAYNCQNNTTGDVQYGYARAAHGQVTTVVGSNKHAVALQQIRDLADLYATCDPETCKDCDLLRQIADIARAALNQ